MDFNAIFETVKGAVEAVIDSGIIDKIVSIAEKIIPSVIEAATSIAEIIAG